MSWFAEQNIYLQTFLATLFTYSMTLVGALLVFLPNRNRSFINIMMGLASGIMIAASFFSLLLPAQEACDASGRPSFIILSLGFILGGGFIVLCDIIFNKLSLFKTKTSKNNALLTFSVTLHNIPEGFAIGVAFASIAQGSPVISALMLAIGIGIQNLPEGVCVALPLKASGMSSKKSFFIGQLSGSVEVVAGMLGVVAVSFISVILPWALAFSAGAMIAVVASELIPESFAENKTLASIGIILGFAIMMFLDVALS